MSVKIFEIYRKIISIQQLDVCNINTDKGILFLRYDNPRFNELFSIINGNKTIIFDCIRENKEFIIIDINLNKLKGFEATIVDIEKEKYTENIHVVTDPFRVLILNKNYSSYNKLSDKLKIGITYLFLLSSYNNQLLDVKKTLKRTNYIEVSDIICLNDEFDYLNNYVEIKLKNTNVNARFLYDSLLKIGQKYKIIYSKSFGSNLYKIIESELVKEESLIQENTF